MADARHFCPDCGSIDLDMTTKGGIITRPDTNTARCPNCGWSGPVSKTIGAVTTEQFWDAERVGEVMLRVMAIHGAGPLVQALEFIGLLPRMKEVPPYDLLYDDGLPPPRQVAMKWNAEAQNSRNAVMQAIMEAAITAAFEEAERQNRRFATEMGTDLHPMLKEEVEPEFGGNVTSIKKARKKRKKRR